MRGAAVLASSALLVAACSGGSGAAPSDTGRDDVVTGDALEFARSARRALTETRYEGFGDRWLSDLVTEACRAMAAGLAPDVVIDDAIASVDAPEGDPVDLEILAEVLTAGTAQVCPAAVLGALSLGDPAEGYLALVGPALVDSGYGEVVDDETAIAAGIAGCNRLSAGRSVEEAAVAALETLFGAEAAALADPEGGVVGPEVLVATTVLAAASVYLCPEHRAVVAEYAERGRT